MARSPYRSKNGGTHVIKLVNDDVRLRALREDADLAALRKERAGVQLQINTRMSEVAAEHLKSRRYCGSCGKTIPYEGQPLKSWAAIRRCSDCKGKEVSQDMPKFCMHCGLPFTFDALKKRKREQAIARVTKLRKTLREMRVVALAEPDVTKWFLEIERRSLTKVSSSFSVFRQYYHAGLRKDEGINPFIEKEIRNQNAGLTKEHLTLSWATKSLCDSCEAAAEGAPAQERMKNLRAALAQDEKLKELKAALSDIGRRIREATPKPKRRVR